MFTSTSKRKFLFKCDECNKILDLEFEEAEDIRAIEEDKMHVECECEGQASLLRD